MPAPLSGADAAGRAIYTHWLERELKNRHPSPWCAAVQFRVECGLLLSATSSIQYVAHTDVKAAASDARMDRSMNREERDESA